MLSCPLKDKSNQRVALFILAHVVLWTFIPVFLKSWICKDMTEHYLWGLEMQWGYYRHPPFLSWLINWWFMVFPTNNFTYYLLSQINIATGFIFIYLTVSRLLNKEKAYVSVIMLELVYFYFFSFKLHHDSILLSLWPICYFFAYQAFKDDRFISWVMLGIFAAIAMLTKYFSVILLLSLFAFYIFQNRNNLLKAFLKPGPFVAIALFLALMTPHILWLIDNDFIPFKYVEGRYTRGIGGFLLCYLYFVIMQPVILSPILMIAKRIFKVDLKKDLKPNLTSFNDAFFTFVILGPVILVTAIVMVKLYRLPWRFGMGLCSLSSAYVISRAVVFNEETTKRIQKIVYQFMSICLLIALAVKASGVKVDSRYHFLPVQKISDHITNEWHSNFKAKLKNITGSFLVNEYMAFYSADHPSALLKFNYKISPWMSAQKIKKEGIAVICYKSLEGRDIEYSDEDVFDDVKKCTTTAENLFDWKKIDWKKIEFDKFEFTYGFVKPKNIQ
ncbi:MAG: glycosyltransferase family 39 protein [Proteobacteria bacterium]|nr:glycosyltransferase family 39 protein [Pseudomonadota bacterium]